MKRLFATDFDGTLTRGGISERSREAIRRFRAAGGVIGVVTGRGAPISLPIFGDAELDFISCCNGALLLLPDGRSEVYASYSADTVRRLWALAISLGAVGFGPQTCCDMPWLAIGSADGADDGSGGADTVTAQSTARLEAFLAENERVCQCNMLCANYEAAETAARVIAAELGSEVNPLQNGRTVDIPACGIDKAFGVRRAAEYFGVAEDMLYAAGNEMNDFAMVSAFHGYAMRGSPTALTEAASEGIIDDVADALDAITGDGDLAR